MTHRTDWSKALLRHLPSLVGQRVLVVAEDADPWPALLHDRLCAEFALVVGAVAPRGENAWPDHRVRYLHLGREWPMLGEFDVVVCAGLYPQWYSACGDHDRIWQWLATCVRPRTGKLVWAAAVRSDGVPLAFRLGGYKRKFIQWSADRVFKQVHTIHSSVPHAEVWVATERQEVRDENRDGRGGNGLSGRGPQPPRVDGGGGAGSGVDGGVVAVLRDAEHPADAVAPAGAGTRPGDGERAVVDGVAEVRAGGAESRGDRPATPGAPGDGGHGAAEPAPELGPEGRGRTLLPPAHPEWGLILGGGPDVWEEVLAWEAVYGRQWDGLVLAVNDVGCHWPRDLQHWVSLHPEKFAGWIALRQSYGYDDGYVTWGRAGRPHSEHHAKAWAGGSSGMYAIQVAQLVGCTHVILCGIPMTATPHFAESTVHAQQLPWTAVAGHWRAWESQAYRMRGWVKSMSGRTQEVFGAPTMEWLRAPPL